MISRHAHLLSSAALLLAVSSLFAQGAKAAPPVAPAQTPHMQTASLHARLTSTTALTVASSLADARTAVTLVANVDGPAGSANGGTVVFIMQGKQIGEVPLSNGSASLTLTDLPNGISALTASYQGDNHLLPSTSKTIRYDNDQD